MKRLIPLIFLCQPVFAADITATTGAQCNAVQPASITIDSGSNRMLFMVAMEDAVSPGGDVATIGGIAETETFAHNDPTPADEHNHTIWIWNEAAIASMSGTTVSGTEGGGDTSWCWGVVEDADQTALGAWDATTYTAAAATDDITTTSTSSDYVIVTGIINQSARTFSTWDTLTEVGESSSSAAQGMGAGTGGDNTTTVTISSSGEYSLTSLVFLNASSSSGLLLRRGIDN